MSKVKKEKMKREIWNIIAKKVSGEKLNSTEESALKGIMTDGELQHIINESEDTLRKTDLHFSLKKIDTDGAWVNINNQLNEKNKVVSLRIRLLQIAAVALMLIASGFGIWKLVESRNTYIIQTAQNDLSHPEVILPDGSKVTLNYNSKIIYPKEFIGNQREVELVGEAFFEVTPNAAQPFIIHTEQAAVKVLGTSFNVLAYDGDDKVEVYVKTGKVELMQTGSQIAMNNKVVLLPGEKGTFKTNTKAMIKGATQMANDLAWITHDIEFRSTSLSEVIQILEHVYKLDINVDENVDLNEKITVTFSHQDPDYIMEVVALTYGHDLDKLDQNTYLIKK